MEDELPIIPVENLRATPGSFYIMLWENRTRSLPPTAFYSITIPFAPFDSGIEDCDLPVITALRAEWIELSDKSWRALDGSEMQLGLEELDASVYLDGAHNPLDFLRLRFSMIGEAKFRVEAETKIDFEYTGIGGPSPAFSLDTTLTYLGLVCPRSLLETHKIVSEKATATFLEEFVILNEYETIDLSRVSPPELEFHTPDDWLSLPPITQD